MKKLIFLITAVFISLTLLGQRTELHPNFFNFFLKQETNTNIFGMQKLQPLNQLNKQNQRTPAQLIDGSGLKQKLDSAIAKGIWKEEYFYDESGNVSQNINYNWEDNNWKGSDKYEYTRNTNGNLTGTIEFVYDNNQWKKILKTEWIFDVDENNIQINSYTWKSGRWFNDNKREFSYDEVGNIIQNINYTKEENQWIGTLNIESTYDSTGNITLVNYYKWESNQWINGWQYESKYDANGNIIKYTSSNWESDQWVSSWKDEYEYDVNGNRVKTESFNWEGDHWVYYWKNESENENNMFFITISYLWQNEEWIKSNKYETKKDENGNNTIEMASEWNGDQWIFLNKSEFFYDNEIAFEDLVLPYTGLDELFNHKLIQLTQSEFTDVNWVIQQDILFYYSEQNFTGIYENRDDAQVKVYPNPASKQIIFNINEKTTQLFIGLFDNQGKLIKSQVCNSNDPVSIEFLQNGLYFYQVSAGEKYYNGKFMVAK